MTHNPKDLADGRRIYTYTARPITGGGMDADLDAIEAEFNELYSDVEPGWRIHHISITSGHRGLKRRGNRYSVRVFMEPIPNFGLEPEYNNGGKE